MRTDAASDPGAAGQGAPPQAGVVEHGLYATYRSGCRCDECRRANRDRCRAGGYMTAARARNLAKRSWTAGRWIAPLPEDRHGLESTYNQHGCRCISCTRAHREYRAEWRARRSAS